MAKLIVNPNSPGRREILLSHSTILTIGRDPSNDVVLPDGMVSRRHAVVEHRAGRFFLRDCNSANGSVVNGGRVAEHALREGDLVAIGSMRLVFREDMLEAVGGKVVQHPSAQPLRCPACGGEFRRGDLFCRECGTQVGQASGPPRAECPSCGAAVPLPARYCNTCGAALAPGGDRLEPPEPAPALEPPSALASGSMAMAPVVQPAGRRLRQAARTPRPAAAERPVASVVAAPAGRRLAAALVDTVFVVSGQATLLAPVAWYWWAREPPRTPGEVTLLPVVATLTLVPLALLLGGLYHLYFWTVRGATPGKELFDLRVETENGVSPIGVGRAALRVLGYLLGAASLGVGFLMVAFGGGLHDRIAGTRVSRVVRR